MTTPSNIRTFTQTLCRFAIIIVVIACISCVRTSDSVDNPMVSSVEEYTVYDSIDAILKHKAVITPSQERYFEIIELANSTRQNRELIAGYDSCQFFDLRTLEPIGTPSFKPFVYYHLTADRLTLRMSNNLSDSLSFSKLGNYWVSRKKYYIGDNPYCSCGPIFYNMIVQRVSDKSTLYASSQHYDLSDDIFDLMAYYDSRCEMLENQGELSFPNVLKKPDRFVRIIQSALDIGNGMSTYYNFPVCYEDSVLNDQGYRLPYFNYSIEKYQRGCNHTESNLRRVDVTAVPYYMFGTMLAYKHIPANLRYSAKYQFCQ